VGIGIAGIQDAGGLVRYRIIQGEARSDARNHCLARRRWLRDATLTLLALMNAGFGDEALAWREWLLRAPAAAVARLT
jgi:hypothetical protein